MVSSTMAVIFLCVSSQQIQAVVPRVRFGRGSIMRGSEKVRAAAAVLDPRLWIQVSRQIRRSRSHGGKGGSGLSSSHGGKGRSGRRKNGGKGTHEGSEK